MTHEEGANPSQAASSSVRGSMGEEKSSPSVRASVRRPRPRYQQLTSMLSPDATDAALPLWLIALRRKRPKMAAWYGGGSPHLGLTRERRGRPEIKMKATP